MFFRRLYQLLGSAPARDWLPSTSAELPFRLDAMQAEADLVLGITPQRRACMNALDEKRRELDAMEEALRLRERELAIRQRAAARLKSPSTS